MSSNKISTKTIARIAAIQTVYQYGFPDNKNIEDILKKTLELYRDQLVNSTFMSDTKTTVTIKLSVSHFELLVMTAVENLMHIDQIIEKYLADERNTESLSKLLLATLRVAICELQFCQNTPTKVVINEFTDIASDMLHEQEVGFVNSVLDRIATDSAVNKCHL